VQHAPVLRVIFWGSNWNSTGAAATRTELLNLYSNLAGSEFQNVMTQYYDTRGWVQTRVSLSTYTDTSVAAPSNVTDAALQTEVASAISANGWTRTSDSQFIVLPAPGTAYDSSLSSMNACGYHSYDASHSSYTWVPFEGDQPWASRCLGYDPNRNPAHVASMVASHEYAESATDPYLNGWTTQDGYEIADICSTGDVALPSGAYGQPLWDNHQGTCVTSATATTPAVVGAVGSDGHTRVKIGDLYGTWIDMGVGYTSVQVAGDPANGPLVAALGSNSHVYAKQGDIGAGFVDETSGSQAFSVATDASHGPLIAVLNGDHVYVKQGLFGAWVDEGPSNQAVSVATDTSHGSLIAVLSNGHVNVKTGSPYASWVDEGAGNQAVSVATDPVHGPLIAVFSNGHVNVKTGDLYGTWVDEGGGNTAVRVATDAVHGPLIGVLSFGHLNVKEGSLYASWVDESPDVQGMSLASDPVTGPLIGVASNGTVSVKQGSLATSWVLEDSGASLVSVAG
jgi:hypothetical protein